MSQVRPDKPFVLAGRSFSSRLLVGPANTVIWSKPVWRLKPAVQK